MTEAEITRMIEGEAGKYRRDLAHVRAKAEEHNADLHGWCVRQRRRDAFRRAAVASCLFAILAFVADTVYAQPPLYTGNAIVGNTTAARGYDTIDAMLSMI